MSQTAPLTPTVLHAVVGLARARLGEGISVTDLADHAGYSPFHFSRLFTATVGVTPGLFLTALRMDAAKRLLLHRNDAVIDIAAAVGFDSLSSFSRRFRASVGVPPASLRTVADRLADRTPRPFALVDGRRDTVSIRLHLPPARDASASVWVGWYRQPAPIGLPVAGALVAHGDPVRLPVHPEAPWLLGFAVPANADVHDHLIPTAPLVAANHLAARTRHGLTLVFAPAATHAVPLLSALPSLER